MSDAAFRSRSQSTQAADATDLAQHYVPKASSLFGGNRMDGVNGEREAANSQIQRSLRAWRKAKDDNDVPANFVPEASGGKPLPTDVRKKMEPRLGADLSGVRMHEGGDAAQQATKLGARAFTVGSNVTFNSGEFNPGTKEGDKLIAHELTHVVQGQKAGVQRKAEDDAGAEAKGGEEKGAEVSDPAEPAEQEADAKGDEVAEDIHADGKEEKGGEKDEKKKDKGKDKEKGSGLDAANEEDEKKKGEGGEEKAEGADAKGGDVKEEAPATAAKLFRKIYLKKDDKKKPAADPATQQELELVKAWIEKEASKVKTAWSAAAIPVGATLAKAGAAAGTLVAPGIGTAIGAAAGAVAGALVSILGISKKKHHVMEEKAKLLDNVDALIQHPEVIHELYDYIMALDPDYATIAAKIDEATKELSNAEKKKAAYDKKKKEKQDKKAGKEEKETGLEKAGEKAHHAAEKVEKVEAGLEVGAAGAEAAGHAAEVIESVAPVLEGAAHVASGAAAVLNVFVTAVDAKTWSDKTKKYNELKAKAGG